MMADTKPKTMDYTSIVSSMVDDCKMYRDQGAKDRNRANEYADGIMKDVEVEDGRSKVVSRDVRATTKKVLPSLIRTILGNEKIVEYQPVEEGDEAAAEQATDFVNYVIFPESNGYNAVQDAIHDALQQRNGIIGWWYDKKISVTVSTHTGLDEAALVQLVADDTVTVLEQSQYVQMIEGENGPVPEAAYDVKIRRRVTRGCNRLKAFPADQFLIHPDALDIEDTPIAGINPRLRRSDLVAMGYDRDLIYRIPAAGEADEKDFEEDTRRRDQVIDGNDEASAMEELEYYELYVRVDMDDDGIAELRRICYAGDIKKEYELSNEEWDEIPYADIIVERRPHQREGTSLADDEMEIQKIKTVLLRQTMDNLYWQNMPQPIAMEGAIVNPDAVMAPGFGKPIRIDASVVSDVRAALGFTQVPFVAAQSFGMLEYLDKESNERTGINEASGGLPPDALQNITAKASAMIEQSGIAQTELMVRTIAQGLKRVFEGLLKLEIKHQDKPRTVMLRKEWKTFDARQWNASMNATVNTGLGAGTRERDMMVTQIILNLQKELLSSLGAANNPYVTPDNLYNALEKHVQAAGLHSVDQYFTKPDPATIQKLLEASANKPDPAMAKIQAQAEADQAKARLDAQNDARKMEMEHELALQKLADEKQIKLYQIDQEITLRRQQNVAQALTQSPISDVHVGGQPG